MRRKGFALGLVVTMCILIAGCGNLFEQFEQIDTDDERERAEIAREAGDWSTVREEARKLVPDEEYSVPTRAATTEEQKARIDLAVSDLAEIGATPIDLMQDIITMADSSDGTNDDFFTAISDKLPPSTNITNVLIAAGNLRENVNTADPNEALLAAAAETTAVTMIVSNLFDADGDGILSATENMTDEEKIARWEEAVGPTFNLLEHASGAIEMYNYTTSGGENEQLTEASQTLDDLKLLNDQWALKTPAEKVASLNELLGLN